MTASAKPDFKHSQETYIAALTLVAIILHLAFRFVLHFPPLAYTLPLIVPLFASAPLLWALWKKLLKREFGADLLAGISIITAVILGQYLVAAIVVLMLSGGEALEEFATGRASSTLDALARRVPSVAHLREPAGLKDVKLAEIRVGDKLTVLPHEICPVDGTVLEGHGVMDEAYLTGEPYQISKTPGSTVISGAINGETAIVIRADKVSDDSRYARIMRVMHDTEQQRPQLRRLGDQLGAWYTPLAVGIAVIAAVVSHNAERFLAVVVIATPCPLLLAIPTAIIGAISLAARRAIIIKNPSVLEQISKCRTLIFDKTGTLTYGKPTLTEIICTEGFQREQVLQLGASAELYSKHPLAGAIVAEAKRENIAILGVEQISEKPGAGLLASVGAHTVRITGRNKVSAELNLPELRSGLECLVFIDDKYAAAIRFHDTPRKDTASFVQHLQPKHGVAKVMLVSGDRESEVRYLAESVGITEVHAGKSPEEKVAIVKEQSALVKTLFVGDGINDAPALLAATVGIAFGTQNDITTEAADAVVLEPALAKIDELMHIAKRLRRIALQSALGGMAASMLGMVAAAFGLLPPIWGAVGQEVIDLLAVLNAVRVALPTENLRDF
ncbi:MAG: heavy metal translocating P-type ATPase [Candidatus Acidiferrum sp.]